MKLTTSLRSVLPLAIVAMVGNAAAVTTFTESFNTNASNWLNGSSTAPTYVATGGVGGTGYISHTVASVTAGTGSFGSPATQLMFRANSGASASGGAFVGNWITSGVETLTLSVRHNNATSLDFYLRIAASAPPGAGASLTTGFSIAPNTWTDVTIPIVNSTSSFSSYGAGDFNTVFAGVQNIQFGFYLPEGTYTNLTMDIDNVGVTVPEPSAALMGCAALGLAFIRRRRA